MLRQLIPKSVVLAAWIVLLVVAVGWVRSRRHAEGVGHVHTKVPGAVGHYSTVEGAPMWMSPPVRMSVVNVVGGYVLYERDEYIDGAPVGWRWMSDDFNGFTGPLPTNRFGFAWHPGVLVLIPLWAVFAAALTSVIALHVWRWRSNRPRRGFPINAR